MSQTLGTSTYESLNLNVTIRLQRYKDWMFPYQLSDPLNKIIWDKML